MRAAEQAAQVVAEFVRALKEQIQVKMKLSPEDPISLWMVRWASIFCSKYMVGADSRTPYERRRERRCRMPGVPFDERVLFKQIREGKTSSRAKTGKVCGWATIGRPMKFSSERSQGSFELSLTDAEVRAPDATRLKNMQGTPQQPDPTRLGVGIPIKVRFSEPAHVDEAIPNQLARQEQGPRRMWIMPYMLEKYGFTEGCEGCWQKQAGARDNSETCRVRIMEAIRQDTSDFGARIQQRHRNEAERSHDGGEGSAASSTDAVKIPVDDAGLRPDVDMGLILKEGGVRCLLSIQATDTTETRNENKVCT